MPKRERRQRAAQNRTVRGRHRREKSSATPSPGSGEASAQPVRINRFIARSGVCSRRQADDMIRRGLVQVNGQVVTELGTQIEPGDRVVVNGRLLTAPEHVYLLMNKPGDCITTTSDDRERRTVMDLVTLPPERRKGLFPVGRLDRKTTGVLLITNDGELGHRLTHPSYEVGKDYRVVVTGDVTDEMMEELRRGVELEDGLARADRATVIDATGGETIIGLRLHEGRNRIVRRMMEALGLRVKKLHRHSYAGLTAKGVRAGHWRHLAPREVSRLRRLVRLKTNSNVER